MEVTVDVTAASEVAVASDRANVIRAHSSWIAVDSCAGFHASLPHPYRLLADMTWPVKLDQSPRPDTQAMPRPMAVPPECFVAVPAAVERVSYIHTYITCTHTQLLIDRDLGGWRPKVIRGARWVSRRRTEKARWSLTRQHARHCRAVQGDVKVQVRLPLRAEPNGVQRLRRAAASTA
jgi:hypothetical protein